LNCFSEPIIPCRAVPRKSQVLLSTLQKLKEDSSPYEEALIYSKKFDLNICRERRVRSDDEIPAIKIVRKEEKPSKKKQSDDDDDDDDDEEDDLQQYLKRKEARQYVQKTNSSIAVYQFFSLALGAIKIQE